MAKVPPAQNDGTRVIASDKLERFTYLVLSGLGVPDWDARIAADVLVDSSLRGIDTHGVEKMLMYAQLYHEGALEADPPMQFEDQGGAVANIDAGFGLGFVPTVRAADLAVAKARDHGVGAIGVRNSGHFGAGGYYARRIAESGLVGFVSTNARPLMPAESGNTPLVGNNPFAFGAPRSPEPPFVFDMSCSVSAFGKVRRAAAAGEAVPTDWGYGHGGVPTDDPNVVLKTGLLAAVGGYKGFNLALMMEILSAALCGASVGGDAGSVGEPGTSGCGHFVMALDPARFGAADFEGSLTAWLARMRDLTPDLRIPGEAGEILRTERLEHGIPVPEAVAVRFDELARQIDHGIEEVLQA